MHIEKSYSSKQKLMTNTNLPFPQFTKTEGVPSSWTKGKMTNLLLLSGLSSWAIKGVKGGQAYENCLVANGQEYYSVLLNYPFVDNETALDDGTLNLCCNNTQCVYETHDSAVYCVDLIECYKISEMIICESFPSPCVGIVGNTNITSNTTVGSDCFNSNIYNITSVGSYLPTITPRDLDKGYALWAGSIPSDTFDEGFLYCGWDNGGWECFFSGQYCLLQFTALWPGNSSTNPQLGFVFNPFPSSNNINIPLIVGTTVGSTTLVSGSVVAYCFWRKRTNQKSTDQSTNATIVDLANSQSVSEAEPMELTELERTYQTETHQVENNQLIAQIQQVNY